MGADSLLGSLTNPQTLNRYAYVGNDPLNFTDPTGHARFDLPSKDDSGGYLIENPYYEAIAWQNVEYIVAAADAAAANASDPATHEAGHSVLSTATDSSTATAAVDLAESTLGVPQNPGGSYQACRNLASIPESAANDILSVSRQEGTDPTLLAVTWSNESSFSYNAPPYPRREGGRIVGYDVGLMGIATNIWNKSPYTDGLSNPFGTEIGAAQFGQRAPFNGNALDNLRLGARALNASSGWPGRPTNVSSRADAAGIFRAGSRKGEYWTRVGKFNKSFRAYDRFFNCMQGKPY